MGFLTFYTGSTAYILAIWSMWCTGLGWVAQFTAHSLSRPCGRAAAVHPSSAFLPVSAARPCASPQAESARRRVFGGSEG